MDQTKRSRACEQELARLHALIEKVPTCELASEATGLIVFEDESEPSYDVRSLVQGNNDTVDRIITVLATLCLEAENLIDEANHKIFPPLLLYGEYEDDAAEECSSIRSMSLFVPFLVDLSFFLGRVGQVSRHLVMQIYSFHRLDASMLSPDRSLGRAWRTLGDLLSVLLQTDEVINSRDALKQHWNTYIKAMETAQHNPAQFGTSDEKLRPFISTLLRIDAQVMAANSFRNCYEQAFGALDEDAKFASRFKNSVSEMYDHWEKAAGADVPDKRRLTAIIALATFYQLHFMPKDKKLLKKVWASHKKIVAFHLTGDLLWVPCQFLLREVTATASIADKKSMDFVKNAMSSLFATQSDSLVEEAFAMVPVAKEWAAAFRLEMWQTKTRDASECLRTADHILKGARLADSMSRLLKTLLNCENGDMVMSKRIVLKIFAVIQAIKLISRWFTSFWPSIVEVCHMACQQWRCHLMSLLDRGRLLLRAEESSDPSCAQSLAALNVAAGTLLSSSSRARLIVFSVALDIACHKKLAFGEWSQVPSLLSRLETLARPRRLVARVADCSFLFYHRQLFHLYYGMLLNELPSVEEIELTQLAITDCAVLARQAKHVREEAMLRKFQEEMFTALKNEFLIGLCGEVENDLRVLSHKHLKVDDRDKTSKEKYEFFGRVLHMPSLRILDQIVNVKEFVEDYLEKTFYNLTAVALHDSHTYAKMTIIAEFRYDLHLIDGQLPYHTLNQSLDVVHVMKSLNTFVATYNYDLYHQLFVEKQSASKSLRILSWEHMANSLRTHGMGVVNTSVNIAYKLLRKKLSIVNQFLDDEYIRTLLRKEIQYYAEHRKEWNKMYPVKRAEKMNRAMKELGQSDERVSYFDRFRLTITELGNALGFVRSIKSAADLVINDALVYDTVSEDWLEWRNQEEGEAAEKTREGTEMLRRILKANREQDVRNRQYIQKLVSVFAKFLPASRFPHLPSFFIVVPALSMNFVEHLVECQERTRRRVTANHKEYTLVDDGFVLGVTYLLSVLDGWEHFSTLNWFRSAIETAAAEKKRLEETKKKEATKTNTLKVAQFEAYEKEFKLLSNSFQSARMFFAQEEVEEEPEFFDSDEES